MFWQSVIPDRYQKEPTFFFFPMIRVLFPLPTLDKRRAETKKSRHSQSSPSPRKVGCHYCRFGVPSSFKVTSCLREELTALSLSLSQIITFVQSGSPEMLPYRPQSWSCSTPILKCTLRLIYVTKSSYLEGSTFLCEPASGGASLYQGAGTAKIVHTPAAARFWHISPWTEVLSKTVQFTNNASSRQTGAISLWDPTGYDGSCTTIIQLGGNRKNYFSSLRLACWTLYTPGFSIR